MTLKQFLKPDWRKIVIMIILVYLGLFSLALGVCWGRPCFIIDYLRDSLSGVCPLCIFIVILDFFMVEISDFFGLVLNVIYWYLLSCLIVWIYDKVKKK